MNTREASAEPTWIRRMVVAADGSPASLVGLEQATDLAAWVGAKVVVVHVRHVPVMAMSAPSAGSAAVLESLDELESEVRKQAARILGSSGAAWDFVVRSGSPGEEIVEVVSEVGADIVVVGSNRHSSLHNLVLGSTAAYLTTHSPVPVLVMRSPAPAEVAHSR